MEYRKTVRKLLSEFSKVINLLIIFNICYTGLIDCSLSQIKICDGAIVLEYFVNECLNVEYFRKGTFEIVNYLFETNNLFL